MRVRRIFLTIGVLGGAVFLAVLGWVLHRAGETDVGQARLLPDGSSLKLDRVVFTSTNFMYSYQTSSKLVQLLTPILPATFRSRFSFSGGTFGFGGDGNTNLYVVTVHRAPEPIKGPWSSTVHRLQILDELGDRYDAAWGANTLGMPGATVHGYTARAFPRRSKTIKLVLLAATAEGWTNAAEFRIPNPAYALYPQWKPEPFPTTKTSGNLAVTLREFQSGARMPGGRGAGDEETAARMTRMVLDFAQDGMPATNWRVQSLTISDPTGNRWSPYLDLINQEFTWSKGGTVEQFGALWPGEDAWKLQFELIRTAGFAPEQLWDAPLDLPGSGTVARLTNHWSHEGLGVELVGLASPNTDHKGAFQWTAKWWGEDKNAVYSLALQLDRGDLKDRRLSVVKIVDNRGEEVKLMLHGSQDSPQQAVFFKPEAGAASVRITFAIQRSRFVEFLARPEFARSAKVQ
jgi:hypothetical protein